MANDLVVKGMALGGQVRVIAIRSTALAQTLKDAQDPGPVGAVALSRSATAVLLMSATLKGRQTVGLQINGNGPLGEIYAVSDATGRVRATVAEPRADVPLGKDGNIYLANGIGLGRFTVIKKLEEDGDAYRGIVPIVDGELAPDLTHYYEQSEQLLTAVGLGEIIGPEGFTASGGYFIQALPNADEAALATLAGRIESLPKLGPFFAEGGTPEGLLERLFDDVEIMASYEPEFFVPGGREKFARLLITLGSKELTALKADNEVVEVRCHFTGNVYTFNQEELSALIYGAKGDEARLAAGGAQPDEGH